MGTLIAHAYNDPETYVGVILGTGTNAAYVERVENIPKWMTHYDGVPVPSGKSLIRVCVCVCDGTPDMTSDRLTPP